MPRAFPSHHVTKRCHKLFDVARRVVPTNHCDLPSELDIWRWRVVPSVTRVMNPLTGVGRRTLLVLSR